jgi:uncharacterized protein
LNRHVKLIYVIIGTLFLIIGVIGVFLPILPTTPFLLVAVACYAKGSKKLYDRLLNDRWIGIYIKNYREGKGIPLRGKVLSIFMLWFSISFSIVFFIHILFIRIMLIVIAVAVTIHLLKIRSYRK